MKFYNVVAFYLSIISLFSCFVGVAASQVAQTSQSSEVRIPDISLPQSVLSKDQMEEDSDTKGNGREMLDEGYKKSIESFRMEQLAKQQKYAKERELTKQQFDVLCKVVEEADKQVMAAEEEEAGNRLAYGQQLEFVGSIDEALAQYQRAAELGNEQAKTRLADLCRQTVPAASRADASYQYALECEKNGSMSVAIGLYEQAAKLGNKQAIDRLQALKEADASNNNNNLQ